MGHGPTVPGTSRRRRVGALSRPILMAPAVAPNAAGNAPAAPRLSIGGVGPSAQDGEKQAAGGW